MTTSAERSRRYRQLHPERHLEQNRRWAKANPDKVNAKNRRWRKESGYRWRRHGITPEAAEDLWFEQGCVCAGCGAPAARPENLFVNHDHACCPRGFSCGKCIRGLVCHGCNMADALAKKEVAA